MKFFIKKFILEIFLFFVINSKVASLVLIFIR